MAAVPDAQGAKDLPASTPLGNREQDHGVLDRVDRAPCPGDHDEVTRAAVPRRAVGRQPDPAGDHLDRCLPGVLVPAGLPRSRCAPGRWATACPWTLLGVPAEVVSIGGAFRAGAPPM